MRNRPEDIYKKDNLPRFARRRYDRQEAHELRPSVAPAPSEPGESPGAPDGMPELKPFSPLPGFSPGGGGGRRRRRHRHGGNPNGRRNAFLLAGLVSVAVLYLGLVAYFKFRRNPAAEQIAKGDDPSLAAGFGQSSPTNATPAAVVAPRSGTSPLAETRASLEFLDKMDEHPLTKLTPEELTKKCEERLEKTPELVDLLLELGRRYDRQGDFARAASMYERALRASPGTREARLALAQAYQKSKQHENAIDTATWVLELEPYSLEARKVLAAVHLARNEPKQAIPHLRAIAEGDGLDMVARNNLAVTYTQVGEYDKAVKLFRGIIELQPNSPIAYNNLSLCLARKKDLVESASVLRQAARKFGAAFVTTWIKGKDFDGVRDTAPFQNLLANLAAGTLEGPEGGSGVLLEDEGGAPEPAPEPVAEPESPAGAKS